MIRWSVLALALIAPAATRTVAECTAEAPCSGEPLPSEPSLDVPPSPSPAPMPQLPFVDCAAEGKMCRGEGWGEIRYGAGDQIRLLTVEGPVRCNNEVLGDPAPNVVKRCARRPTVAPLLATDIQPIASDFDTAPLIQTGIGPAQSGVPDEVGAFRMICTSGQINRDDPILYPGVRGGSPHLHQWFGNLSARYDSTYANLRRAGESTCSNKLNRSAYWVPALMNAKGQVIQPDYISLYYKRRPDGDPECIRMAEKGCVGLPTGLRAVSGFDMRRMDERQPENSTFHFRCVAPGRPSEHRLLIAEAVADCGGSGQVMAMIGFGNCWTGTLDSADHRAHLTHGSYGGWGYLKCPPSHPYVIPELTQGVAYTIEPSDGEVWFASDRMNGMRMAPGTTFHADYMEAWDPSVRSVWERLCIGKLLNCSDGVLGDGSMLRRGDIAYKAAVRLINLPAS